MIKKSRPSGGSFSVRMISEQIQKTEPLQEFRLDLLSGRLFDKKVFDAREGAFEGVGGQVAVKPAALTVALEPHLEVYYGVGDFGSGLHVRLVEDHLSHSLCVVLANGSYDIGTEVGTDEFGSQLGEEVEGVNHADVTEHLVAFGGRKLLFVGIEEHAPVHHIAQRQFDLGGEMRNGVH